MSKIIHGNNRSLLTEIRLKLNYLIYMIIYLFMRMKANMNTTELFAFINLLEYASVKKFFVINLYISVF